MKLLAALHQWTYPSEFRIAPGDWPAELAEQLQALAAALQTPPPAEPAGLSSRLLADVGTGLWRLRQRMLQPGSDQPLEEMRRPYRHLQSVWDALTEAGVEIRDHTGQAVPQGGIYALKVLAYQPTPGLNSERVIETIKPSIYLGEHLVQMGEVIVGTPEQTPASVAGTAGNAISQVRRQNGGVTHAPDNH